MKLLQDSRCKTVNWYIIERESCSSDQICMWRPFAVRHYFCCFCYSIYWL